MPAGTPAEAGSPKSAKREIRLSCPVQTAVPLAKSSPASQICDGVNQRPL